MIIIMAWRFTFCCNHCVVVTARLHVLVTYLESLCDGGKMKLPSADLNGFQAKLLTKILKLD